MDATGVRAFLAGLDAVPSDGRGVERVRFMLETLQRPDVRYLVIVVGGDGGPAIAMVMRAILRAAGAPTALLGEPIDDPLLARAGTLAAAATYQLAATRPELGEPTRRDVDVTLALTAFAEDGQRVTLLLDEMIVADDPLHAPVPDLLVLGRVDIERAERALGLVPDGRPIVVAAHEGALGERIDRVARDRGVPLLLGGRDFRIADAGGGNANVEVGDQRYGPLPVPRGVEPWQLATGVAAALGAGVLGIRMREEWVAQGVSDAAKMGP